MEEAARSDNAPLELRVRALHIIVFLMNTIWEDTNVPRRLSEEALLLARTGHDLKSLALAASVVEAMSYIAPRPKIEPSPLDLREDAVALARRLADPSVLCLALICRGIAQPDIERQCFEEALSVARDTDDVFLVCLAQTDVAIAEIWEGELDLARAHLEETIAVAEQVGNVLALTYLWSHLGKVLVLQQSYDEAAALIRRSLIERRRRGIGSIATEVANLACCATRAGDPATASLLYGSADAMFTALGTKGQHDAKEDVCASLWPDDKSRLRGLLGDEQYERLYRSGGDLTPEEAVRLCLRQS